MIAGGFYTLADLFSFSMLGTSGKRKRESPSSPCPKRSKHTGGNI